MMSMQMARLITVIQVEYRHGRGTEEDPARLIREFWSTEGELLARVDTHNPGFPRIKYRKPARIVSEE